jgi:hypothetical protein
LTFALAPPSIQGLVSSSLGTDTNLLIYGIVIVFFFVMFQALITTRLQFKKRKESERKAPLT